MQAIQGGSLAPPTTDAETGATSVARVTFSSSVKSAAPPVSATTPGESTTAASESTVDAVPTSPSASLVLRGPRRRKPSTALPMMAVETGVPSATRAMLNLSARSADLPASAATHGASTIAASGSTAAAAPTLLSEAAASAHLLVPRRPRSLPAPPTTVAGIGVTLVAAAIFASTGRSAARPALRVRPGASTTVASGSTAVAAQSSASANHSRTGATSPEVAPIYLTSLKPSEKNPSAS